MFAGNGFRCPLTGLAERYGAEHRARTPDPTARQAPHDGSLPLAELVGTGLEVPTVQGGTTRYVNLGYAAGVSVLRAAADRAAELLRCTPACTVALSMPPAAWSGPLAQARPGRRPLRPASPEAHSDRDGHGSTVWIGVGVIVILVAGNLRGVRQAGAVFAVPTYAFIAAIAALVAAGLVHAADRGFHSVPARHLATVQAVTVLLVLRAFASGSTAMTGIEAISNAVPAFKPIEWRNARITLSWMIGLLITMFSGVLVISRLAGIVPVASQTMLSQLAHSRSYLK
jgi:amino acid transporter